MPRYTPVALPQGSPPHGGAPQGNAPQTAPPKPQGQNEACTPLQAGMALAQAVREEHGREGVRAYIAALNPLLPRALLEQLAAKLNVPAPPPAPPSMPHAGAQPHAQEPPLKPPQKEAPNIPPELLLQLLQGTGGSGGGFDPSMLLKLLQK